MRFRCRVLRRLRGFNRYRIPVICLYRPAYTARCTAMVAGDDGVELIEYTDDTFDAMLETLVNKLTAAPVS